jgi:flagellar motor switch protein FliN/FliY
MSEALFLKTLSEAALETTEIPLFGSPPPFPLNELATALAKALETESCTLKQKKSEWLETDQLFAGMGSSPRIVPFNLSPLPGTLFFVLPESLAESLLGHLLSQKTLTDPVLKEGLLTHTLLQALEALNSLNPYGNLTAVLAGEAPLPEEGALASDFEVALDEGKGICRILMPKDALAAFRSHFTMETPPLFTDKRYSSLLMPLHLEVGSTTLSEEEWQEIAVGDFVLLDRCTLPPNEGRGTAILTLGNTPIFDVRIKDGECKILQQTFIQEAPTMTEEEVEETNTTPEEPLTPSGKIPMQITVEVGRLQMPLEKITELSPGNVLDLKLPPTADVHLTVGGKRIAKGELVNLGEALGVKILNLGE